MLLYLYFLPSPAFAIEHNLKLNHRPQHCQSLVPYFPPYHQYTSIVALFFYGMANKINYRHLCVLFILLGCLQRQQKQRIYFASPRTPYP
jgi:hypothetical protein